jgi:CTP:molybdopterin cytidylyltransferase MocA
MLKSKLLEDYEGDKMVLTCARCQHEFSHDVSNLILVVGNEATFHEVRSRAVCRQCNTRGDNTYRMVPKTA